MKRSMIILALLPLLDFSLAAGNVRNTDMPAAVLGIQAPETQVPAELQAFYDQVKSHCVSVDYEYTVRTNDAKIIGKGKAEVQTNAYRMTMNGMEVFCDGKSLWMNDSLAQEVMIDLVDSDEINLLDNPILFVAGLENLFDISVADGRFFNPSDDFTIPTNKVVMIPNQTEEVLFIDVHYNLDFTAILGAVLYMKDGSVVEITIPKMSFDPVQELSHFVFHTENLPKDYIVTDLR